MEHIPRAALQTSNRNRELLTIVIPIPEVYTGAVSIRIQPNLPGELIFGIRHRQIKEHCLSEKPEWLWKQEDQHQRNNTLQTIKRGWIKYFYTQHF